MKILLVSSFLPFPLHSGGHVRLYNLLKLLSKKHEITLICEKRSYQTDKDIQAVEKVCSKVITVQRKKQWSLPNVLKAGVSQYPFLLVGHQLPKMTEAIKSELGAKRYDLIHVETFYVLQNVPETDVPILLVEHNIEYKVYERFSNTATFFLKPLLRFDIEKIKRAEKAAWERATKVATVSEDDKRVIGRGDTEVIANGVDLHEFTFKKNENRKLKTEKKILYIGDYKWIQNTDAAKYIITKIWPEINRKLKTGNLELNVKLWLVGRNMPESLKVLGKDDQSIVFDDKNTQSAPEIFREADILLAPKRVGGGTSYKTLEAMAVGTPVVTTSLGLEGLDVTAGEDLLVADKTEELAEQVVAVLTNEKLYKKLAASGRKQVEEKYSWESIGKKLGEVYTNLALSSSAYAILES